MSDSLPDILKKEAREGIITIATKIISEEINILEGVREIDRLRTKIDLKDDKVFYPIRAISSETEQFPLGEVRTHYNQEYLSKLDVELEEYLKDTRLTIIKACKEILEKLQKN